MLKIYKLFIFLLIILTGSYLRLVNLETNPSGLYVDEASTGVNAWSILQTGKDEYGKVFPSAFRFFGSYTPPLYTYTTSLVMYFNGLSIASIRLVSALSGILMIVIFFHLLKSLNIFSVKTIFLSLFLFVITP